MAIKKSAGRSGFYLDNYNFVVIIMWQRGLDLYRILFYRDKRGHEPVLEYIDELDKQKSKDSKIKLSKILDYINILETYGTVIGEPYIKPLGNSI